MTNSNLDKLFNFVMEISKHPYTFYVLIIIILLLLFLLYLSSRKGENFEKIILEQNEKVLKSETQVQGLKKLIEEQDNEVDTLNNLVSIYELFLRIRKIDPFFQKCRPKLLDAIRMESTENVEFFASNLIEKIELEEEVSIEDQINSLSSEK